MAESLGRTKMAFAILRNLETLYELLYSTYMIPIDPTCMLNAVPIAWLTTCCNFYLRNKDFLQGAPHSLRVETEHHIRFRFQNAFPLEANHQLSAQAGFFLFLLSILSRRRVAIPATVMACCPSGHADTHGPESGKGREARGKAEHWYDLQAFMSFHCFLLGLRILWNFSADNKHSALYILLLVTPKNPRNIIFFYKPSWSTQLRYCFLCGMGKQKSTQGQLQQF